MLGNSDPHEKMAAAAAAAVISSSTTNEWPQMHQNHHHHQHHIDHNDQKGSMMPSSSASAAAAIRTMEKPGQEQLQQQQQALKCPRCDSSNTKFCYYNNYSLSQPRHFCKACKRYWTRGGTLRNVPVGGGCRKNKRVRRPGSASAVDGGGASTSTSSSAPTSNPPSSQPQIDLSSPSNHHMNPLFFGLPGTPSDHMGFPFPRFNSHVDNTATSGFDHHPLHQPQLSALGLGFGADHSDYRSNRFNLTTTTKQIQDLVNSNSVPPNYSIFSTSPSSTTTTPTMASVLASKFINGGFKDHGRGGPNNNQYFQTLLPFEDLHIAGSNGEALGGNMKEVKSEDHGGQNRMEWDNNTNNNVANNCQNQSEQMGISSSDPTTLYWSSTTLGGTNNWHDPTNLGSSVSSLI